LDQFPQYQDEFRDELEAAQAAVWLAHGTPVSEDVQLISRERFLLAGRTARALNPGRFLYSSGTDNRSRRVSLVLRYAFIFLLILFILFAGSFSVIRVSASSLPGEPLHPIKLWSEQTRLWMERDPLKKMELLKEYDQRREDEFNTLLQQSTPSQEKPVQVILVGLLVRNPGNIWTIDQVDIRINPDTKIIGQLADGFVASVNGLLLEDGSVVADRIEMRQVEIDGKLATTKNGWKITNIEFSLTPDTVIQGELSSGARATVILLETGQGKLVARLIRIDQDGKDNFIYSTLTPQATSGVDDEQMLNDKDDVEQYKEEKPDEDKQKTSEPESSEKDKDDDEGEKKDNGNKNGDKKKGDD